MLSERKVKIGGARLKHSAKDKAIYSNFKAERKTSWLPTATAKEGSPGCHRTEPPTFDGYLGVVRKQLNEEGFCGLAMRLTTVHRDSAATIQWRHAQSYPIYGKYRPLKNFPPGASRLDLRTAASEPQFMETSANVA